MLPPLVEKKLRELASEYAEMEKLKSEGLATVRRESTFLRYSANTRVLEELLGFLFEECCSRSKAVNVDAVAKLCSVGPLKRSRS